MGKHNGKARKSGLSVGSALVNRAKRDGRTGSAAAYLHTTEVQVKNNMQSVIESNDLEEMMAMVRRTQHNKCAANPPPQKPPPVSPPQPPPQPPLTPAACPQADLAGKDFTAEKEHVIVISTGAVANVDHERVAAERREAEDRNRHRWGRRGPGSHGVCMHAQSAVPHSAAPQARVAAAL